MNYKKKPVEIEAEQWFGWKDHPCGKGGLDKFGVVKKLPVFTFFRIGMALGSHPGTGGCSPQRLGWIETLEGGHIIQPFDFVIKGVKGEFYPCKPDIFEQTYEAA